MDEVQAIEEGMPDEGSDSETSAIIARYDKGTTNKRKRRRGAPNKGNVSNNNVEKCKP